ncbi:MAG: hypothetical protein JWN98_1352 [Abditibacteriota bacterium]|jgi:hypothetical protein|nr:hypothetical protein [Abditibacteriota bacterium]
MRDCTFDYAVIRVVPRVERQEFVNVGVLLSCPALDFLQARIELDRPRLAAFAPWLDLESIEEHLQVIRLVCAGGPGSGPIGALPQRARFHWLVAPRSTMIQLSPFHSGLCPHPNESLNENSQRHPQAILDHLFDTLVCLPCSE